MTDATPMTDADLAHLKYMVSQGLGLLISEPSLRSLIARLTAAEAERDAAVARADAADLNNCLIGSASFTNGERQGERRATAAIVAWLRKGARTEGINRAVDMRVVITEYAAAIERGDHLNDTRATVAPTAGE